MPGSELIRMPEPMDSGLLSPQQEQVIITLLSGSTQKEAAAAVGVAEETVSRWCNSDPEFIATLNLRRRELWESAADRLRSLTTLAIDSLTDILENSTDDSVKLRAALGVLKAGALAQLAPPGPEETDPDRVALTIMSRKPTESQMLMASIGHPSPLPARRPRRA